MLVKICGLTRASDVKEAVLAGADLLGLNFHPESPRAVSFATAQQLTQVARSTRSPLRKGRPVRIVALFVGFGGAMLVGIGAYLGVGVCIGFALSRRSGLRAG